MIWFAKSEQIIVFMTFESAGIDCIDEICNFLTEVILLLIH